MSYNEGSQENSTNESEVKKAVAKPKKKKVDKFKELTDKIILKEGYSSVREFERKAIQEARQKLKEKFVAENIDQLL